MPTPLGKITPKLPTALSILIIEDNPMDRELLRYLLEARLHPDSRFTETTNLQDAYTHLQAGNIDCVILDLTLPDSVGKETFTRLTERFSEIPVIVMTHNKDRELALEMIKAGAADYLLKDYTNEEDVFQRIMFAVTKARESVRVPPDDIPIFRRLEKAQRGIESAKRRQSPTDMHRYTAETTHATADVSRKVYAEIQKLSRQVTRQAAQQEHMANTIDMLDKELLRGHSGFPPMKTQVNLLGHRIGETEIKLKDLSSDVDEVEDTQRREALKLTETKMTNRTKIIIAIFTLIGVMVSAVATYFASMSYVKP